MEISIYKRVDLPTDDPDIAGSVITVDTFFKVIKNGTPKHAETLFKIRQSDDKAERDALKITLPAVSLSGVFHPTRAKVNLVKHSLLLGLDIDSNDTQLINSVRSIIRQECPYLYADFLSSSARGLCIVFKVAPTQNTVPYVPALQHKQYYVAATEYLRNLCAQYFTEEQMSLLKFDSTNDVTRPRYLSYDPNMQVNAEAQCWDELADIKDYEEEGGGYADGKLPFQINSKQTYDETVKLYTTFAGSFGIKGARHDWVRGLFVWLNRAGVHKEEAITRVIADYPITDRGNWAAEHKRTANYVYSQNAGEFGARAQPIVLKADDPRLELRQLIEAKIVNLNSYKSRKVDKASELFIAKAQEEINQLISILERL
jgi:hypothetical protein